MYSQLAKQSSPRNSIDSPARIVVIKILILDCSFAISRPKDKIIQYAKKQRGMIPFFSFVGLFLLLSEIFTLWKIIYITLQLSTDHYGRLPLCKSWEHPLLSIPHLVSSPSPPPLPPAPNCSQLVGKGLWSARRNQWHWEADCWGEVGCWQCGDRGIAEQQFYVDEPA